MINKAEELKYLVANYWRFTRGYYLVAVEYNYGHSDVISVSEKGRVVCETEVKISIADLKKEQTKPKHLPAKQKDMFSGRISRLHYNEFAGRVFRTMFIDYFYFAVPENILEKALDVCEELYPYAGLLCVHDYESYLSNPYGNYISPPVSSAKDPKKLTSERLSDEELMRITRGMSNSFCSLAYRYMREIHSTNNV